ncbi:MAG: hypothetical protein J7M40_18570 [Planctomycetes bacterium]|nr:hypothetical protein [Planctomycetota bacterium]
MARADKTKAKPSRVLIADEFPLMLKALADKVDAVFKLHQMAFEWVQEDISPQP